MSDAPLTMPHALEAEQAILGAILLQNDAYSRVSDFLKPEHFFEPIHAAIYDVASKMIVQGKLCRPNLIVAHLPVMDLGEVTLGEYVSRLAGSATTVSSAADYGRAVHEMAMRRAAIAVADQAMRRAYDMPVEDSADALIQDVTKELAELSSQSSTKKSEPESISISAAETVHRANEIRAGRAKLDIIHTGITSLDRKMGGIARGNHVVIAGRPGSGKTALAVQIAMNIARRQPVLYFSLEMTNEEIAQRAMSNLAYAGPERTQLPYQVMRDPTQMSDDQMRAFMEAEQALRGIGLVVDQTSGLAIEQIVMRTKMMAARLNLQGKKLGAVLIDHIGLVKAPKNIQSRVHQIEHITNAAKDLAKSVEAPVFSLAQLNRTVEQRDDKRPQLADLRDSGSIEQDADFVIGVYREDYYIQKGMWKARHDGDVPAGPHDLEARILKNRHGGEAPVLLWCDMPHNVIGDLHR